MNPLTAMTGWLRRRRTLGRWALRAIPDIRHEVRIAPIGRLAIRLRRNRSFWLRHPLTHEGFILGALRRLVRPGDTAYDVGANIGLYTRFMAHFGAGRIVALEPMSENRPLLMDNIALGGLRGRVVVLPCALADRDGQEALQIDRVTTGSAALDRVTGGRASESHAQYGVPAATESVEVRRLDALLAERPEVPAPDVIKIDIEGAEGLCLAGAEETLRVRGPRLVIEMHEPARALRREVVQRLEGLGYFVYGYTFADPARRVYRRVTTGVLDELSDDLFDLHHVVASKDESDVARAIGLYRTVEMG